MPWPRSPMEFREQFVREYQAGRFTMIDLCAEYRIAPKTGYKWVQRFAAGGRAALADRSRRPHHSPQATPDALVELILDARRRHPHWGARKVLALLRHRHGERGWPARSTASDLLKRAGLIAPRRRAPVGRHLVTPLPPVSAPNAVWTTDFKGEFRTGDGRYCYPLTLRDGFSRYVLRCDGLDNRTSAATRRCFERAFAEYGLPDRIRSDNGQPFAGLGFARLSRLAVWWMHLGIVPERIAPGRPEQNGSHEQFHRILKAETARPPAGHRQAQQRRFTRFCAEYNEVRPHEALHDAPPATCYTPSRRPWSARVPTLEYPGHCEIRRVSTQGHISWRGTPLFVSEVLAGHALAFEEIDDGIWTLTFATVTLGRLDERTRTLTELPRTAHHQ